MDFDKLPDDLKEKASKCENMEELLDLARSESIELSDEVLDNISGGMDWAPCGEVGCTEVCNFQNCGTF